MSAPISLATAYPVLGLRVTAGPIELSGMDDDTLIVLANLAFEGVHAPDAMPFLFPWTLAPADRFHRGFLQYHWGARAGFGPERWALELAVRYEGELVGIQGVTTEEFLLTRTGETGGELTRRPASPTAPHVVGCDRASNRRILPAAAHTPTERPGWPDL